MEKRIQHYKWFFSDQLHQIEIEQKSILVTPISQLLKSGIMTMGYVDNVVAERGHIIIKFPKGYAPRMKATRSFVVVKKSAFATYGNRVVDWSCTLGDFKKDPDMHSSSSEILPLYFLPSTDGYEYVECSSISIKLFDLLSSAISKKKNPTILIYDQFPPIDYFMNLIRFMDLSPDNKDLLLEPTIDYEEWRPIELSYNPESPDNIANTIMRTLAKENCCILQGPPGTGKSYVIASIIYDYINKGNTVCATTMANKGLMELILQKPLKKTLSEGKISKTNISADERMLAPNLKDVENGLLVPSGELLCCTNYVLSGIFSPKHIENYGIPNYDLIIVEEASQAFLTTLAAFKSLGVKCLIVGDPMQLPPIVRSLNKPQYRYFNSTTLVEGLSTFALGSNITSYRITTTHRLTAPSASLTGLFYKNSLSSVSTISRPDFSLIKDRHILKEGGVIYEVTNDVKNSVCSDAAIKIIDSILSEFKKFYPLTEFAIIAPFRDTVKELQKHFLKEDSLQNITIETVDRIQGMTVDYTIVYFPGWKLSFALDDRRFNVATSRSRTTTLIISDTPLENMHTTPEKVNEFISRCVKIDGNELASKSSTVNVADDNKAPYNTLSAPKVTIVGKIDLSKFEKKTKVKASEFIYHYIIDTNVFINCPFIIDRIDSKHTIVLSAKVADELDKMKIKLDEQGRRNAEKALKYLNSDKSNRIIFELSDVNLLPDDFEKHSPDNMILSVALKYKTDNPIILTSDNGLQLKSKILGIQTISLKQFLK